MVHVDRLHLSMGQVGIIGVIGAIVTTATYPLWGVMVDRIGSLAALRLGTVLGLLAIVGYLVAPSVILLWVAAAAMGAAGAASDTAIVAILSEETTLEERGPALAGWNGTTGIWGIASPLAMSLFLGLGVISVNQGLADRRLHVAHRRRAVPLHGSPHRGRPARGHRLAHGPRAARPAGDGARPLRFRGRAPTARGRPAPHDHRWTGRPQPSGSSLSLTIDGAHTGVRARRAVPGARDESNRGVCACSA